MRTVTLIALAISQALPAQKGVALSDLTWPDAEARLRTAPIVLVPFGAGAKEHGPQLPLGTDAFVLQHLLKVAIDSMDVIVAPPILTGWFPAFREFPGTEIADPDVFWKYAYEVARSLAKRGAKRIVFLNTGVSRSTGLPLSIAARELYSRDRIPALVLSWDDLETDAMHQLEQQKAGSHADELETSIMLVLRPDLVHMDRAVQDYHGELAPGAPGYRPGGFSRDPNDPDYSVTGVFGDPTLATAEKGRKALAIMDARLLVALRAFSIAKLRL